MKKALDIFRHEVISLVARWSFWFGALGVPVVAFLVISGIGLINRSQAADPNTPNPLAGVQELLNPQVDTSQPQGYIDQAGLILKFPENFPREKLIRYAAPETARKDMDAGKIGGYYVIPADYIQAGKLYNYTLEYNMVASESRSVNLRNLIEFNLLHGDERLQNAINRPLGNMKVVNLAPPTSAGARDKNSEMAFLIPYGVMMLFFIAVMGSATLLLNSIAKEKENRVIEVLMMSATPHELLLGKILGLGFVSLFQVIIWGGSSFFLLRLGGQTFNLPDSFVLSPSILVWGVIYFLLGFLVYATLMAGLGALVPNLREASQASFIITLPMMIPIFLLTPMIDSPDGGLAVGLSLFPLTSPTTMMMRLVATDVPLWQMLLSLLLLVVTALLVIRMVAGMFRAQTILSGQAFNIKRFFLALAGRG